MLIMIDNYDSFVFNLARYFRELNQDCMVIRNDQTSIEELERLNPKAFIMSPGPCGPSEAGICLDLVKHFHETKPLLGVCLGHQVIAQYFGMDVVKYSPPKHGKISVLEHCGAGLLKNIPSPLKVGRYHSLTVRETEEGPITIDARSNKGEIMAISHKTLPIYGVQFHPESVLTEHGHDILTNFLKAI